MFLNLMEILFHYVKVSNSANFVLSRASAASNKRLSLPSSTDFSKSFTMRFECSLAWRAKSFVCSIFLILSITGRLAPQAKEVVGKFEDDLKDDLKEEERERLKSVLDLCSNLKLGNDSLSLIFEERFVFGGELTLKVWKLTFNFYKTTFLPWKSSTSIIEVVSAYVATKYLNWTFLKMGKRTLILFNLRLI